MRGYLALSAAMLIACAGTPAHAATDHRAAECSPIALNLHTEESARNERRVGHRGVDFTTSCHDQAIVAIGDGEVMSIVEDDISGDLLVVFHHRNIDGKVSGLNFLYAHVARLRVRMGDRVTKGQILGEMWTTDSDSTWVPHVHLELMSSGGVNGADPLPKLDGCSAAVSSFQFPVRCSGPLQRKPITDPRQRFR
jgi:hypothetical protein